MRIVLNARPEHFLRYRCDPSKWNFRTKTIRLLNSNVKGTTWVVSKNGLASDGAPRRLARKSHIDRLGYWDIRSRNLAHPNRRSDESVQSSIQIGEPEL